ncbi:MAG: Eco57I restriction-modification methylase domain-containing protein, partial [Phycisphaerales bacterium]|nr:Eco57I restriction-modification methylase domain-containing protein [Phycisphaerales bacterium]
MPVDLSRCRTLLNACDLDGLFVEVLGWDRHKASHRIVTAAGEFALRGFAEKRGFAVFICPADSHGRIPDHQTRAFIDRELTKIAREHLLIYVNADRSEQLWQWVRRGKDQPIKRREFGWRKGQASGLILERVLPSITFALSEEEGLTLPDVTSRATVGFDVEKVTKRFFERFQSEHKTFHKFITGIKDVADRDWYASVMLNRLMFCYFIQKKGLLDGDHDYLRNRLIRLQQSKGKGNFWSFYRHFLLRLFHEGLGQKPSARKKDLDALVGRIPYLNGGLFDIHELETRHSEIQIPDEAFERLFAFFDEYRWHLDERPLRENNEINPDVLGYIFEKYINQKQMGAYYTKEDITGYIAQNTILPFILDHAAKNCAIAFKADSSASVWRLLKDDPDAYIYEPVQRGVIDEKGEVIPLPPEIEAGVGDVAKRTGWNKPAPAPYALPTETWREHVARRQRCLELRRKLAAGEVTTVNDLVTLNLDIRQFVEDMIDRCEGPELLRAIWRCLVGHVPAQSNEKHEPGISILDPTCGSGAFLFAALNILEPLYEACLDRMEAFLEDLERAKAAGEKVDTRKFGDFRRTLADVAEHPNQRYFILKSIIVNNLYGVDIMEEACEICKLRLFLKLVAQVQEGVGGIDKIEPLPDIDFNIRAGNTLVGFTGLAAIEKAAPTFLASVGFVDAIKERAEQAASVFRLFREMQTKQGVGSKELAEGKTLVREKLNTLHEELDRYLASEYEVNLDKPKLFAEWLKSHEPFHWFVDFYAIMAKGGFDVIVGNPPYVQLSEVEEYSPRGFRTLDGGDLYGLVMERALGLLATDGAFGMIVPVSVVSTDGFAVLRKVLLAEGPAWTSSFAERPSKLFTGVEKRLAIWLMRYRQELCIVDDQAATLGC